MSAEELKNRSAKLLSLGRELLSLKPQWAGGSIQGGFLNSLLDELQDAVDNADGNLVLGLLGGTGVGKSSLISALAGAPVSAPGIIRPTTNLPLIYRHQSFPAHISIIGQEFTHNVDSLKNITIVDFPDFDSFLENNRQSVLSALSGLDLVLWVSDYNKYADRAFYELMDDVNSIIGSISQHVILNKCDALPSEEAVDDVLNGFERLLKAHGGWEGGRPLPVSALESLAAPENPRSGGLGPLRDMLAELRDLKLRKAVEHGNIMARLAGLIEKFQVPVHRRQWRDELEALKKMSLSYTPQSSLDIDLAALGAMARSEIEKKLNANKNQCRGLLKFFNDIWDFVLRRKTENGSMLKPAGAAMFSAYMRSQQIDLNELTPLYHLPGEEFWLTASRDLAGEILADKAPLRPAPRSWPLWLWPFIWLFLSVWAEAEGRLGFSIMTAAFLRAAAPWLIFAVAGNIFISRFIWFRRRRLYEHDLVSALNNIRQACLKLADEEFQQPLLHIIEQKQKSLNLLEQLELLNRF